MATYVRSYVRPYVRFITMKKYEAFKKNSDIIVANATPIKPNKGIRIKFSIMFRNAVAP